MAKKDKGNRTEDWMTWPTFEIDSGNGAIQEGQVLGTTKKRLRIQDNFLVIHQEEKVERNGRKERSDRWSQRQFSTYHYEADDKTEQEAGKI